MQNVETVYPLSHTQQGMLFHSVHHGGTEYLRQLSFEIVGEVNAPTMRSAWQSLMDRHAILRTSFLWDGLKEPVQVVHRTASLDWTELDWTTRSKTECEELLDTALSESRKRGFDLRIPGALQCIAIRKQAGLWHFILTFHHIILDGWSVPLLMKEAIARYEALCSGAGQPLSPAPPYRDYIAWLRRQDTSAAEAFWRDYMAGFTAATSLGVETVRQPSGTRNYAQQHKSLTRDVTEELCRAARRYRVTLNTMVEGAWAALLSRYSGQNDVVFGTVVSGRPHDLPRVEEIAGLFINTLPVRVRTEPDISVAQYLVQMQQECVHARQYQHASLVDIQRWAGLRGRGELFESIVVFQNFPSAEALQSGAGTLTIQGSQSYERTHYPLTLMASPSPNLEFLLIYDTARFGQDVAQRMLNHLEVLLQGIAARPEDTMAAIPMMTEEERARMEEGSCQVTLGSPNRECVHALFAQQAARAPMKIAAVFETESLTYDELNRRSNQLAHYLLRLGVRRESLVAVCLERSLDILVALLGILKAGGAYVPLDPEYPADRLRYMLEDSQASVLVTDAPRGFGEPSRTLLLEDARRELAQESCDNPGIQVSSSDLAYVIYTSGSTGKPKGVMIPHGALSNLLESMRQTPGIESNDVLLAITTPCFDIAALELFLPLIVGAEVVIARRDVTHDPDRLAAAIDRNSITVVQATPTTWHMLIQAGWKGKPGLKALCGGEALSRDLATALLDRVGSLWNVYGPTETTVWSTVAQVGRDDQAITIGRPIGNTTVYILDRNMKSVPVGVVGELYIGGEGLARGYLNRPELTAQKFVSNPFGGDGSRLYRTGDLARYRPDFSLECLGREDHQIKIRGFRIELGEIETALRQHPVVREAVVVARGAGTGHPRLVSYIVPSNGIAPVDSELRSSLKKMLPDYMIPDSFIVLSKIPLTPNGKIDRNALPDPVASLVEVPRDTYVEPRNMLERQIAVVWAEVLGRSRVGITDDFFDLGGHSLLAVRVATELNKTLRTKLPINLLFQCPTIEQFAASLNLNEAPSELPADPPAERIPRRRQHAEPVLSFGEEGLALLQQFEPDSPIYSIPSGLRLRGALNLVAVARTLKTIVARHETLRSRFYVSGNTLVRSVQTPETFHLEVRDLLQESDPEASLDQYLSAEARRPFRLDTDLPFRACLFKVGHDDHTLFVNFSHVSADGWSLDLWLDEFAACYTAFAAGHEPHLPELPIRYSDYAAWERTWIESEDAQAEFEYWQQQLSGTDQVLAMPTDRPRPERLTYFGAIEAISLTPTLVNRLKSLARSEHATLFMVLLAGWHMLLHRYTGQEDILVGSPIANRTHSETQNLIGLFMNMLALRVDMADQPSFRQLLQRVREATLGAYAHQQYPFEHLIHELKIPRDLSRTPVFQNIFILQSADGKPLVLPGLDVSWRDVLHTGTAKTDLTLSLAERDGGIAGWLEYNTDLFEPATARRMIGHFEHLLEQATASPDTAVPAFSLMNRTERDQILFEWNATSAEYPRGMCTYELIADQAARTPDRLSVIHEGSSISYRELNSRSNRLAHFLRKQGIGPEVLAGVQVERSPEMLIALLAVWKAGGGYVPLDTVYPQERRDFMIQDSGLRLLITSEYLNENAAAIAAESDENPAITSTPENLAYVIYTSGSTGKPKGVEITHRAFLNLLWSFRTEPAMVPDDALLAVTTISFDIAGLEMFLPLITGAHTVIATRDAAMQPEELKRLIEQHRISVMQATPATWRALLDSGWAGKPDLKVLCGGEALPHDLASRLQERCRELWNVYGPTETTVWSSIQLLEPGFGRVLIGRPIANTTMYVLDAHLNLVPPGVVGELYIGGDGLARGYRNRPELTAERFIEDPFSPGSRLYHTGDLARWMPDGSLVCLGRTDHQVKIRGFRIELEEIETFLKQQPGVRQAIVAARGNAGGAQQLVGYLVPEHDGALQMAEIRAALKRHLPEYMVPAALMTLDSLPTTANGKIDRKALPDPGSQLGPPTGAVEPPADAVESRIATIFEQVLGILTVGVTDNFFEKGGHSLLAVRLMSELEKAFGLNLALATLFQASTPRELAAVIRDQSRDITWTSLVPLKPDGSGTPFFCVHSLGANLISYRNLAQLMDPDQPFYGLQPLGLDGEYEVQRTVEEMAAHYLKEIRKVQPHGPYNLGGVCLGGIVAFEMAQQLRAQREETAILALIDSYYGPRPQHMPKLPDRVTPVILADYYLGEVLACNGRERLVYVLTRVRNIFVRAARAIKQAIGFKAPGKGTLNRALENIHEAHSAAERNYVPGQYPGRVTLFWCSDYPARAYHDKRLGWCDVAEGGLEVHIVPGTHMTMLEPVNVEVLAKKLSSCLRRRSNAQPTLKASAAHA